MACNFAAFCRPIMRLLMLQRYAVSSPPSSFELAFSTHSKGVLSNPGISTTNVLAMRQGTFFTLPLR